MLGKPPAAGAPFAAAAVLAEQMESRLANGEQIDIQEHALLCSTLTRLAQRIGIERRARDVTPSLSEYLAARYPKDEIRGHHLTNKSLF